MAAGGSNPPTTPTPAAPSLPLPFEDEDESERDDLYERVDAIDHEMSLRQAQLRKKLTNTFQTQQSGADMLKRAPSTIPKQSGDDEIEIPLDGGIDIPPPPYKILLSWQNIHYGVTVADETARKGKFRLRTPQTRRNLLNGVSGEARPGELMVILGPSGCGKTTLLNILSARLKLHRGRGDQGLIFVNGEKRTKRFKRHASFVLQEDLFFSSLTVQQTLELTGQLLLRCGSDEEKTERVNNMISLLRLEKCQNGRVGNAIRRGLSGGEKKRLNVANELLIDPALIFLDEPTSGLDACLAEELLSILSLLAKSGRTVITTLHQPSSQIFAMVDKVYVMGEGGRVAYFGPASEAVSHFSRLGLHCPQYYNPADFLLDLVQNFSDLPQSYEPHVYIDIPGDGSGKSGTLIREHSQTHLNRPPTPDEDNNNNNNETDSNDGAKKRGRIRSTLPPPCEVPPPLPTEGAKWPIGWCRQAVLLGKRAMRQHIEIAIWNLFIFLLIAGIGSIVWWDRKHTFQSITDRMGLMFFVLLQWFLFPMFGEVNSLVPEMPIITKERREGMYRLTSYACGKTTGELLLDIVAPVLFTVVIYWTTNLNNDVYRFFGAVAIVTISYLLGQAIGFLVASWLGSIELSSPILLIVLFVTMLVSGFYASLDNIPDFFAALQYVSPLRYLFDAFVINEFSDNTMFYDGNATKTGYQVVNEYNPIIWDGSWACVWYNLLVIFGMTLVCRAVGFVLLRRRTGTDFS